MSTSPYERNACIAAELNRFFQKLVEAALPRHLQLASTALEYENSVLAYIGECVPSLITKLGDSCNLYSFIF